MFFLFKNSLSLWILAGFLISLLFKGHSLYLGHLLIFLQYVYAILLILNFKFSKTAHIRHLLMIFISFLILNGEKFLLTDYAACIIYASLIILFSYILLWFINLKLHKKKFVIKTNYISSIFEFMLILSLLLTGNNSLTSKILAVSLFDVFFQIIVLTAILHLNKRFNMLSIEEKW